MPDAQTMTSKRERRWFSTGFMGGGVASVDAEKHTLHDAVMIRPGEALGHDLWIDAQFCQDVIARANERGDKGLKARFGHPNMCSEALGTFLGRWKGLKADAAGRVTGDLFLSSTAAESPKGDLRKYVEEMAAKEPEHFGASIVFSRDEEAENAFMQAHLRPESHMGDPEGQKFQSPDPANTRNLPHARCAELHAADLVDDPAATDGMFAGIGGASLAAEMTEWLDLHPQVLNALNDDPALVNIVERYADQLKPFLARYNVNSKKSAESACQPPPAPPAEPDPVLTAKVAELTAEVGNANVKCAAETARADVCFKQADEARMQAKGAASERDAAQAELAQLRTKLEAAEKARTEAETKLAAIVAGQPPVSATPAEKTSGSMWDDARKSRKH